MKLINDLLRHTNAHREEIERAAAEVIKSGWFVLGPETVAFEEEFASYCGVKSCIGLANGTDAIELAVRALGLGEDARVALVANAGGYGLHALRAARVTPVFVEVDAATMNMAPAGLEEIVESQASDQAIAAVIFTHLYGNTAGVEQVASLCARRGIPLIEDCAQAHGATIGGRKAGAFGAVGCFSFYPTKNLGALGDGGAAVTSDAALATRLKQLRQYGWGASKYVSEVAGARNSRLDELQAAVLRVKLPHLDGWNARRRQIAEKYDRGLEGLVARSKPASGAGYVAHLYVVKSPRRADLRKYLKDHEIGVDVHYPVPDYRQPSFQSGQQALLPVTEKLATEVLTLPCYPEMTDPEVDAVIAAVAAWAKIPR